VEPDFACNSANRARPHSVLTTLWNEVSMDRSKGVNK